MSIEPMRNSLPKLLLLLAIAVGLPALSSPALAAGRWAFQGRRHPHRRDHHRERERRHEERGHGHEHDRDNDRHGEL
jgi:hypothetical protein